MNWDHLRTFLFVARHRSLAAAARQLGVSPRTVAQRLALLELIRGSRLLYRVPSGFVLTRVGERALTYVLEMERRALPALSATTLEGTRPDNLVRIATGDILVTRLVTPAQLAPENHRHNSIVASTRSRLPRPARRDTEIAIRGAERLQDDKDIVATWSPARRGIFE